MVKLENCLKERNWIDNKSSFVLSSKELNIPNRKLKNRKNGGLYKESELDLITEGEIVKKYLKPKGFVDEKDREKLYKYYKESFTQIDYKDIGVELENVKEMICDSFSEENCPVVFSYSEKDRDWEKKGFKKENFEKTVKSYRQKKKD
ncbi:MAG: hypothetical protein ACOCRX_08140 [Candidatus Woesearchaeota archaeon]